jgi:ParB-like chromosome segregation protein Spo0J
LSVASTGPVSVRKDAVMPSAVADGKTSVRTSVTVPVLSLRSGDSPRLTGEDKAHIARLAECETPLPPIIVSRRTMQVIDGMHRLMAASLRGQETVEVEFFDGGLAAAFLLAVKSNTTHGLPLSLADRRAAAARIISIYPYMSDRAVGETAGLAARTVAAIRRRSTDALPQLRARIGRDGKARPLNAAEGRLRAAALLTQHPDASLREVARGAGVSPATARDVRQRLERGEEPAPGRPENAHSSGAGPVGQRDQKDPAAAPVASAALVTKLLRDPSLRHSEQGRRLLQLLQLNAAGAQEWPGMVAALPPHGKATARKLARQYGLMWLEIAQELEARARIVDPWSVTVSSPRNNEQSLKIERTFHH